MNTTVAESTIENKILATARLLGEYFYPNKGHHGPTWILVPVIREMAKSNREASPIELFERFVAESRGKYRRYLSQYVVGLSTAELASVAPDVPEEHSASVYTGARKFSFARLSAMVSFFIARENPIGKQKLNDLLFYSDFTCYYTYCRSISWAKYVRRPNAPVMHCFDSIITTLYYAGAIKLEKGCVGEDLIAAGEANVDDLSLLEIVTLLRVKARFESMNSAEIRDYLVEESVFRFTPQDAFIAYEYAHLMAKLPT